MSCFCCCLASYICCCLKLPTCFSSQSYLVKMLNSQYHIKTCFKIQFYIGIHASRYDIENLVFSPSPTAHPLQFMFLLLLLESSRPSLIDLLPIALLPFGNPGPHGDQNKFFGPHFLHFRLKNALKVNAATI